MARNKITVGDLIDLIDYNRDGGYTVMISENDEEWNMLRTDSTILDRISDCEVDSIGADRDKIQIWLHDNAVTGYWENAKNEAMRRRAQDD